MLHQIIALRDHIKKGKPSKYDKILHPGTADLSQIFTNPQQFLAEIPEDEHYSLYFTPAHCGGKRELLSQRYIPFDIDHVDLERATETFEAAALAIGAPATGMYALCSGYGVQFFVELAQPFTDPNYFDRYRDAYKGVCDRISRALKAAGLPGDVDPSVFSMARLMRFPETENRKTKYVEGAFVPARDSRRSFVINATSVAQDKFDLEELAGVQKLPISEQIVKWPPPDTDAILAGCRNIALMLEDPEAVGEPLWYANASIFAKLPNGRELWHQYSQKHKEYDHADADRKLDQASSASGPRTCSNFATVAGNRCETCPNYRKVKSPITIQGDGYIRTKDWGFHERSTDANGNPTVGKPNYTDLLKWFEQQHPYLVNEDSEQVYTFNGKHYVPFSEPKVKGFAEEWFEVCSTQKANEFKNKLLRTKLVPAKWFAETTLNKMNFSNGILDVKTGEFIAMHSRDFGFMNFIPYDYDPGATAPVFEKFIEDVTVGDNEIRQQLLEFAGYCFSNDDYWDHHVMILLGDGENGKSVFLDLLKSMVTPESYSVIAMRHLSDPQYLADLEGKLFNAAGESASDIFKEADIFKDLAGGGEMQVKTVYQRPYKIRNRAKLLFACNKMPPSHDHSHGFLRRFSIAPFKATFKEGDPRRDPFILKKLQAERAGIFNLFHRAYQEMLARGYLYQSESGKKELAHYKASNDYFGTWFEDNVVISKGAENEIKTPQKTIYAHFASYCEGMNIKPMTGPQFYEKLRHCIPKYTERSRPTRIDGSLVRVLYGVKIGSNDEPF